MRDWPPTETTPTRFAEDTDPVGSDAYHYSADAESTRSDLSESFDTDTSTDDQRDDEERDVLSNSDSPDDLNVEQGNDSDQEESDEEESSISETSGGPSHDSLRIGIWTAASEAFGAWILREAESITISDDLSQTSKLEERQFHALRATKDRSLWPSGSTTAREEGYLPLSAFTPDTSEMEPEKLVAEPKGTTGDSANRVQTSLKRRLSDSASELELDAQILGLDLVGLQNYIGRLTERATDLKIASAQKTQPTHRHLVLYRIQSFKKVTEPRRSRAESFEMVLSAPFLDVPEWIGPVDTGTLHCKVPIQNFELFLERNKDIAFIIFKTYASAARRPEPERIAFEMENIPEIIIKESIRPITKELVEAVRLLLGSQDEYADLWHDFKATSELPAPYLFVFHQRGYTDTLSDNTKHPSQEQLTLLWNYVIQKHGDEYTTADASLSKGKIFSDCTKYLFKPGDILVQRKTDFCLGWVAKSWAKHVETYQITREIARDIITRTSQIPLYVPENASKGKVNERVWVQRWTIPAWNWDFDGNFQRKHVELSFSLVTEYDPGPGPGIIYASKSRAEDAAYKSEGIPISDLEVFPIRYAPQEVTQKLRRRGKAVWKCRNRKLVSYEELAKDSQESMLEERYMVDLKAYRTLHKSNSYGVPGTTSELHDELGPEAMAKEEPPDDRFELLLPPTIKGFNLRRKKWFDLVADRITDVEWNEDAFRKVVMNSKAKDLIQALVSNQLASEASTDLIENKGNGLILLLHGSPGTGKTLTAEGVAEITKKPLYRVTCADIGTKPEEAEKYLESILHLGKLWRCVVLLDEADVFLEQRSLEDLKRNSLVSVFLRVLEYYEGILILTSNRVGTFDEAFKSRIQLALHYPALGPYERLRIWENFLERLEKLKDPSIDVSDLRDHLKELQVEEMNGRQIRNAITTARQYAKWKNVTLTYTHLKDVIDVAGRFDRYLDQLHGGRTQDQLAEEEGVR